MCDIIKLEELTRPNLTQGSEKNIKKLFLFFPSPFVRLRLFIALNEIG
jgi:hypothetical protein